MRLLFDTLIEAFLDFAEQIGSDADIIVAPDFEEPFVLVGNNKINEISAEQRVAVAALKTGSKPSCSGCSDPNSRVTLLKRAIKRKKWHNIVFLGAM